MATISELKYAIKKEKGYYENEREINNQGLERKKLEKELKDLIFKRKYGKYIEGSKPVISGVKTAFKRIGTEFKKVQTNVLEDDRRKKAIRKKGFVPVLRESRRGGIFG